MVDSRVPSPSRFAAAIGFCAATRAGGWVHVAGQTALDGAGTVVGDGPYGQAREALRKVGAILAAAGAGPADVVATRVYLTDAADWAEVGRAHGEFFGAAGDGEWPAATMVAVAALLDPRLVVEVEATAHVAE